MADYTTFAHFTGHQLPRAFFEAIGIDTAVNPDAIFGYFHGMIL
jgi:hypothetical protein